MTEERKLALLQAAATIMASSYFNITSLGSGFTMYHREAVDRAIALLEEVERQVGASGGIN